MSGSLETWGDDLWMRDKFGACKRRDMSKLPKLRIKMPHGYDEIYSFEKAKTLFFDWEVMVVVEGQMINSFEDLVKLAGQNPYKNKESLEVTLIPFIAGG